MASRCHQTGNHLPHLRAHRTNALRTRGRVAIATLAALGVVAVGQAAQSANGAPTTPASSAPTSLYPPLGVTLDTVAPSCDDGILLAGTCYGSGIGPTGGSGQAIPFVNVVRLSRAVQLGQTQPVVVQAQQLPMWSCDRDVSGRCLLVIFGGATVSSLSPLEAYLEGLNVNDLVVVSNPNDWVARTSGQASPCPVGSALDSNNLQDCPNYALPALGSVSAAQLYRPWSVIYGPGCGNCQMVTNTGYTLGRVNHLGDKSAGDISGDLQLDQNNDLVYVAPDFAPYDTLDPAALPSGIVRPVIDGLLPPAPNDAFKPASGASGFLVEALSRADLSIQSYNVFQTNGNGSLAIDETNAAAMAALLNSFAAQPATLVVVQSYGTPVGEFDSIGSSSFLNGGWAAIGRALRQLGGSESKFDVLNARFGSNLLLPKYYCAPTPSQTACTPPHPAADLEAYRNGYALVGGAALRTQAIEAIDCVPTPGSACPTAPNPVVMLHGILARDPSTDLFEPFLGDGVGLLPQSVFQTAYPPPDQPTTPFPQYPAGTPEGHAFKQIVKAINGAGQRVNPDLRSSYWQDVRTADWAFNLGRVNSFNCGALPTADNCSSVKSQVATEIQDVIYVYSAFSNNNSILQSTVIWSALSSGASSDLQTLSASLISATQHQLTSGSASESSLFGILSSVAAIGAKVGGLIPDAGTIIGGALGAASAAFGLASTITAPKSTTSAPLVGPIRDAASQIAGDLQTAYSNLHGRMLALGEVFTVSWDRLKAMARFAKRGGFTVNNAQVEAEIQNRIHLAGIQEVYASLLPIAYWDLVSPGFDIQNNTGGLYGPGYVCGYFFNPPFSTWVQAHDYASMTSAEMATAETIRNGEGSLSAASYAFNVMVLKVGASSNPCYSQDSTAGGGPGGAAPRWLGQALFGPAGGTTPVAGTTESIDNAAFDFQSFFEQVLPNCVFQNPTPGLTCDPTYQWPAPVTTLGTGLDVNGRPAVARGPNGLTTVAARDSNNDLVVNWELAPGIWHGRYVVPNANGLVFGSPAMVIGPTGLAMIATKGPQGPGPGGTNSLYVYWQPGDGTWAGPLGIGAAGSTVSDPSMVIGPPGAPNAGLVTIAAQGFDGNNQNPGYQGLDLYYNDSTAQWHSLIGVLPGGLNTSGVLNSAPNITIQPAGAPNPGLVTIAFQGPAGTGRPSLIYDDSSYNFHYQAVPGAADAADTVAVVDGQNGLPTIALRSYTNGLDVWQAVGDLQHWNGPVTIGPDNSTYSNPSIVIGPPNGPNTGLFNIAAQGPNNTLDLYYDDFSNQWHRIPGVFPPGLDTTNNVQSDPMITIGPSGAPTVGLVAIASQSQDNGSTAEVAFLPNTLSLYYNTPDNLFHGP